jgi:drug/metabolite transporter (DMT)-like permease
VSARRWLPSYLALVLFWGCSFLFNEWALRSFSPVAVAFGRIALGGVTVGVVVLARRLPVRLHRAQVLDLLVLAAFLTAVPFALIALAQTRVTSILAGLLNATTPLWTAMAVVVLLPQERGTRRQTAGLLLGFVGIAILLGVWDLDGLDAVGALAMIAATACYGFGTAWMRARFTSSDLSGASLSFVQVAMAGLLLAPLLPLGGAPQQVLPESVVALVGLGVLGTGVAYVLFWRVVRAAGATTGATITYLIPLVSTALGIVVLGEPLTWNEPVGGLVVLLGVALAQGLLGRPRSTPPAESDPDAPLPTRPAGAGRRPRGPGADPAPPGTSPPAPAPPRAGSAG